MAHATIVPLTGLRLPEDGSLLRDFTREEQHRDATYLDRYDRRTVFYDCQWRADLGRHVIHAPTFLNLWEPFAAGLAAETGAVRIASRRPWKRSEQVLLDAPRDGLSVTLDGITHPIRSRASERDRFAGLRLAITLNRNNRLDWIFDWATYHVRRHGMEAVAIADNDSTLYPLEDLRATLAAVEGLKQAVVYHAPFPYGPSGKRRRRGEKGAKFFQSGMLNVMRDDAAAAARSVLSVDIDELVLAPEGRTVFEMTERHPLGMLTFHGRWSYPARLDSGARPQREHVWRTVPSPKCHRKWCIVPTGIMGRRFLWDAHQIGGLAQNLFTTTRAVSHAHCRATTTNWRNDRFALDTPLHRDADLAAALERYIGPPVAVSDGAEASRS